MKEIIKKIKTYGLKKSLYFAFLEIINRFSVFFKNSYSQYKEDLYIDKLLRNKKRGFYLDIGAYDGIRFSNSYRFYKKGWRGVNIEPSNLSFQKLLKNRKKDINLNIGLGKKNNKLVFYEFFPNTLSTFSKKKAQVLIKQKYDLTSTKKISVKKISYVINNYLKHKQIDFLSIDTEGSDFIILKECNWKNFKPKIICVEKSYRSKQIDILLKKNSYEKILDTPVNLIYKVTKI